MAALLAEHGAVIIDADKIAREVVEPGTPGFAAVMEHFGEHVRGRDGSLDRAALASVVFADDAARAELNGIVHPLVAQRSAALIAAAPRDAIVVYDVPLLAEVGRAGEFDAVVVVLADESTRLRRLVQRGMTADDARARMATQASDEQRLAIADEVIDNGGSFADLERHAGQLWGRLTARRDAARA